METQNLRLSCHYCGKQVECASSEVPCQVLKGWLTVSHWKGPGEVSHYHFCSLSCLKCWADTQVPKIPQVFLKSFEGDESKEGKE